MTPANLRGFVILSWLYSCTAYSANFTGEMILYPVMFDAWEHDTKRNKTVAKTGFPKVKFFSDSQEVVLPKSFLDSFGCEPDHHLHTDLKFNCGDIGGHVFHLENAISSQNRILVRDGNVRAVSRPSAEEHESKNGRSLMQYNQGVRTMNFLVFVITTATNPVLQTPISGITNYFFNESDESSVAWMYKRMSHGQLPVTGLVWYANTTYTSDLSCNTGALEQAARATFTADSSAYTHFLFLLPDSEQCPFAGAAYLCYGGCSPQWAISWYPIGYGTNRGVIIHEIGHNNGLHHASKGGDEYGDGSCPMGEAWSGPKTYNLPHMAALGWLANGSHLQAIASGSSTRASISAYTQQPQLLSGAATGVMISSGGSSPDEKLWVSWLKNELWNSGVPVDYIDKVDWEGEEEGEDRVTTTNHHHQSPIANHQSPI